MGKKKGLHDSIFGTDFSTTFQIIWIKKFIYFSISNENFKIVGIII